MSVLLDMMLALYELDSRKNEPHGIGVECKKIRLLIALHLFAWQLMNDSWLRRVSYQIETLFMLITIFELESQTF